MDAELNQVFWDTAATLEVATILAAAYLRLLSKKRTNLATVGQLVGGEDSPIPALNDLTSPPEVR